ncbi:MAG: hypothetical protein H6581_08970 [Bacteroidia bacterium]|nr:hypothetical protein [Bacteroidia bacterium]
MITFSRKKRFPWRPLLLPALLVILLTVLYFFHKKSQYGGILPLYCGAEETEQIPERLMFTENGHLFRNGETQSDENPRTGKYSAKLTPQNLFGIATDIPGVKAGDDLVARVWRYTEGGYGVLTVDGDWGYFHSTSNPGRVDSRGWEQLNIRVKVPEGVENGTLRVYCWNVAEYNGNVYFDDYAVLPIHDSLEYILPASSRAPGNRPDTSGVASLPVAGYPLRAHLNGVSEGITRLTLYSVSDLPVEIVGIANPGQRIAPPREKITLPPYRFERPPKYYPANFSEGGSHIFYRVEGFDSVFSEPILPWKAPTLARSPRQELFSDLKIESNDLYEVKGDQIRFREGIHTIQKPVIFPAGYEIYFPVNASYDFVDSAFFMSASPVFAREVKGHVDITSSDHSAKGFTVLQAKTKSELNYMSFDGFGTFSYKGWNLTGAVTFYESDVDMNQVSFSNNHCEDGLNVVRSRVNVAVNLENTAFDAFDCDFCTGEVKAEITKAGNDGLDFSGSELTITSVVVHGAGDKGISIGEECTVRIDEANIYGANIGLASKDLSQVDAGQIQTVDCNIGFAAYQKKPEYGGGRMKVEKWIKENVKTPHAIEEGSELILEGEKVNTK